MDKTFTRIDTTKAANKLIDSLKLKYGEIMFHQSGGCCDGSAPMCYPKGEFYLGGSDVEVGITHGVHFYMGASQFAYWEHTHLTLDAIPGNGGQFSLENGTGTRFIIRSRLYSDEEWVYLSQHPVKQCG
ncbi:MAG: DUF779 domain-containing protein [Candidatus Methylopumilus sp.]|nr:DUF779 domain-containing protein [Candidatus Methylopumilus sp.]